MPRLPGPPLTNDTALVTLIEHGVTVGIGIVQAWQANTQRFEVAWVRYQISNILPSFFSFLPFPSFLLSFSFFLSLYFFSDESLSGQARLDSNGRVDEPTAHALLSTNLEKLLGLEGWIGNDGDWVAYAGGGAFDLSSKPVAVISPARGLVDVLGQSNSD